MKPVSLLLACLLPFFLYAQIQNSRFLISGKIKGKRQGYVYLDYPRADGEWSIDSCLIQQKRFYFTGNITETTLGVLRIGKRFCADDDANATWLYITPDSMQIAVRNNHAKKIKVPNNLMQQEKGALDRMFAKIIKSGHNTANRITAATTLFIINHPQSYISAFELSTYSAIWDIDTVINLYNKLDSNIQNSFYGRDIKKIKDGIVDNSEGKPAKLFAATNIDGADVKLLDFKGKPVLIDFWASWCLPCRQATPHIKSIYNQYHNKGLEVIGVSCDDDLQAWKKAVEKDSTSIWHNVLSNYKNSTVVNNGKYIKDMYAVHGIPVVVIIDKNGMIAGRFTGDDEQTAKDIDEKLREVMR